MRDFDEKHERNGLVSNQDRHADGWGMSAPFASVVCCGRDECIRAATSYVAGFTNQSATYQPDRRA